ncbi:MAG: hypothetical protein ABH950_10150 [Candidatus Altiarchaeota archaeon]
MDSNGAIILLICSALFFAGCLTNENIPDQTNKTDETTSTIDILFQFDEPELDNRSIEWANYSNSMQDCINASNIRTKEANIEGLGNCSRETEKYELELRHIDQCKPIFLNAEKFTAQYKEKFPENATQIQRWIKNNLDIMAENLLITKDTAEYVCNKTKEN